MQANLFYETEQGVRISYSKACQKGRYPVILTDEEKLCIDTHHPGSYGSNFITTDKTLVDCEESNINSLNLVEKGKGKHNCRSIKYGVQGGEKYWYICPRLYDLEENTSLNFEDLKFNNGKDNFIPVNPHSYKQGRRKNSKGEDILDYNPSYKNRTCQKNKENLGYSSVTNASLIIRGSSTDDDNHYYPGFLNSGKHPDNIFLPCCYGKPNNNVKDAFGITGESKNAKSDYIQGWGKNLKTDGYGLLPRELYKFFDMNPSECVMEI